MQCGAWAGLLSTDDVAQDGKAVDNPGVMAFFCEERGMNP
jgi:hypothetical protein